jgi:hypothetical protein
MGGLIDIMQLSIFFMFSLDKKYTLLRPVPLIKSLLLHMYIILLWQHNNPVDILLMDDLFQN